jgi:hypothetical protein
MSLLRGQHSAVQRAGRRESVSPGEKRSEAIMIRKWHLAVLGTALLLAGVQPSIAASRNVTTTGGFGSVGRMAVTVYWGGQGPYNGKIFGSVSHRGGFPGTPDCAAAQSLEDGKVEFLAVACRRGNAAINHQYSKKNQVLVRVCGRYGQHGQNKGCTDWK